jgi:hypothetical protein
MKKRILLLALAALLVLTLSACGSKNSVEGKWKLQAGDAMGLDSLGMDYALVFKSGKLTIEVDMSQIPAEQKAMVQGYLSMFQITYKIKSDTEMELSMAGAGTQTVKYKVSGDTLTLGEGSEAATLVRVK